MFHIVVENGEAFFISDESWLDFLEMRAQGLSLDLHRYYPGFLADPSVVINLVEERLVK